MSRAPIFLGFAALATLCLCPAVGAQTHEFWPELDFYKKLNARTRFFFVAKATKEGQEPAKFEIGPNFDFYAKPPIKMKRIARFHVDESKSRPLLLRVGYRYLPSASGPDENRGVVELTPRLPLIRGAVISDRNHMDLRFINGEFSWRYRNRLTLERDFRIRSLIIVPYARAEATYDSRHTKWSGTSFDGGAYFPFKKHWELDFYFEHQNDTGKSPNSHVNGVGLALALHF